MKIIDCNCIIGCATVNHSAVNHEILTVYEKVVEAENAEQLIENMDYCGISKALVWHQTMTDVNATYGNKKILIETAKYPDRLLPTWTILPPVVDEDYAPEVLFEKMKQTGICAVRAYPKTNRYLLNALTMGELLSEISSRKIPLFLSPESGYDQIYNVLKEFPDLTVIITDYGPWSPCEFIFPLLRAYRNVYLGIGNLQTNGSVEKTVSKFGSERLLFDSMFPVNYIGGAIALLMGVQISGEDRENIACRNIENILKEAKL